MLNTRVELAWLITGLLSLILGALVYIMDRDPATVYFLSDNISFYSSIPDVFGPLGYHLPTFLHCFALILITGAVTGSQKLSAITVCLTWMFIELIFEIAQAQAFSYLIAAQIPTWFGSIPVLDNTRSYFLSGSFDVLDLLSIIAGSAVAYILLQLTKGSNTNESFEK